jgi:hypothetical protein
MVMSPKLKSVPDTRKLLKDAMEMNGTFIYWCVILPYFIPDRIGSKICFWPCFG